MAVKLYPVVAILYFIFLIAQYVINALSSSGPDGTIFKNKTGDLSDKYYTEITPAGWTFSIWGFIYTWQAAWSLYALLNICRKGPNGPAYADPVFLPVSMFLVCIVVCALNITWLISFDREEIELAFAALLAYTVLLILALVLSYRALDKASAKLVDQHRTVNIWLTRGLVHNAFGIQGMWVTIASLLNFQMVLLYRSDLTISVETAGTVALSILAGLIVIFALTDLLLLDRYSRYTITPYCVLVVALSGSLSKNYSAGATNSIFTIVLLSVSAVLLLVKMVVMVYRHLTGQKYSTHYNSTIGANDKGQLA